MPIKPENKHKYPTNWKTEVRPDILERAHNCCEKCHTANYEEGHRDLNGNWYSVEIIMDSLDRNGYDYFEHQLSHIDIDKKPTKIVLTIAHKITTQQITTSQTLLHGVRSATWIMTGITT